MEELTGQYRDDFYRRILSPLSDIGLNIQAEDWDGPGVTLRTLPLYIPIKLDDYQLLELILGVIGWADDWSKRLYESRNQLVEKLSQKCSECGKDDMPEGMTIPETIEYLKGLRDKGEGAPGGEMVQVEYRGPDGEEIMAGPLTPEDAESFVQDLGRPPDWIRDYVWIVPMSQARDLERETGGASDVKWQVLHTDHHLGSEDTGVKETKVMAGPMTKKAADEWVRDLDKPPDWKRDYICVVLIGEEESC